MEWKINKLMAIQNNYSSLPKPLFYSGVTTQVTANKYYKRADFSKSGYSNALMVDYFTQFHLSAATTLYQYKYISHVDIDYLGYGEDYTRWDGIIYFMNQPTIVIEVKERTNASNEWPNTNLGEEEKRLALIKHANEINGIPYILFIESDGIAHLYNLYNPNLTLKKIWMKVPRSEVDRTLVEKQMCIYQKSEAQARFEFKDYIKIKNYLLDRENFILSNE